MTANKGDIIANVDRLHQFMDTNGFADDLSPDTPASCSTKKKKRAISASQCAHTGPGGSR